MAAGCGLCLGLARSSFGSLASLSVPHDREGEGEGVGLSARWSLLPHDKDMLHARQLARARLSLPALGPLVQAAATRWRGVRCLAPAGLPAVLLDGEMPEESDLVEIGFIAGTHGVHGELRVQSKTDFPEERFGKPGIRWLRLRSMSKERILPVQLVAGRVAAGKQPSWFVSLKGVNSPEQASELLGATMLADSSSIPGLAEDEFYIPDLVGMKVALQETGQQVGVVEDVFNSGASDLLRVRLLSESSNSADTGKGQLAWIPFVHDIVPLVDKEKRRIEITPPAGLLELNVRKGVEAKSELRKQAVREMRKSREVLTAIKKKIHRLGQDHVLAELSSPDAAQKKILMESLFSVDFSQFERALTQYKAATAFSGEQELHGIPQPPPDFPSADWEGFEQWLNPCDQAFEDQIHDSTKKEKARWWRRGLQLVAEGKVSVAVLAGGQGTRLGSDAPPVKGMLDIGLPSGKSLFQLQSERLLLVQELASSEFSGVKSPIPWIILTSDATDEHTKGYFEKNDFFGLEQSQVWFVKQESLPCVDRTDHKILMERPTKVALAPNGNGGLFQALSSEGILEKIEERGTEYMQVYAVDNALVKVADPVFFGFTADHKAEIGVKVVSKQHAEEAVGILCLQQRLSAGSSQAGPGVDDLKEGSSDNQTYYDVLEYTEIPEALRAARDEKVGEEGDGRSRLLFRAAHICINMFSVDFLKRMSGCQQELGFHAAHKRIPHVKQDEEGNWVQVDPEQPNGIKFEQFIFDAFRFAQPEKVAILEVRREEEFAPIKNASGPGRPDSPATARELALGLYNKLVSDRRLQKCTGRQHYAMIAYAGGLYGHDPRHKVFIGVGANDEDERPDYAEACLSL